MTALVVVDYLVRYSEWGGVQRNVSHAMEFNSPPLEPEGLFTFEFSSNFQIKWHHQNASLRTLHGRQRKLNSNERRRRGKGTKNDDRLLFMQYIAILLAILCTAMNILWIHLMKY